MSSLKKTQDRRIQRSQQLLRSSLLALIQERGYEALSVQDIIDRANVGRATFYAHFDNKDDLLTSGFDEFRTALREIQREAAWRSIKPDDRLLAFSYEVFRHVNDHRPVFRAMVGKQSGATVQRVLHKILLDLVREDVKTLKSCAESVPAEALAQFVAGAWFGLILWWMEGKMRISAEEINSLFRRLALPAMKAAGR